MKFRCRSWKVMENDVHEKVQNNLGFFFFCEENSKDIPKRKDDFQENGQI